VTSGLAALAAGAVDLLVCSVEEGLQLGAGDRPD
jgi:hypothetical protein